MKNKRKNIQAIIIITTLFVISFGILFVSSNTMAATMETKPPILNVKIDGLLQWEKQTINQGDTVSLPWISDYIVAIYKYAIVLGSMLAVIVLMIGGFMYLTSMGADQRVKQGRQYMTGAIMGLVILLFSYMMLNQINPKIVAKSDGVGVQALEDDTPALPEDHADTETPPPSLMPPGTPASVKAGKPRALTVNHDELYKFCKAGSKTWPAETPGMMKKSDSVSLKPLFGSPGLKFRGKNQRLGAALLEPLKKAGQIANDYPGGPYVLHIRDAYRTLYSQMNIACGKSKLAGYEKGEAKDGNGKFPGIGNKYAYPGSSFHGIGVAVDILLEKNGAALTTMSYGKYKEKNGVVQTKTGQYMDKYQAPAGILADIMYKAGWKRYTKEIWHFEYNGAKSCRTNNCKTASTSCSCVPPK
jgi:hypothetical protein